MYRFALSITNDIFGINGLIFRIFNYFPEGTGWRDIGCPNADGRYYDCYNDLWDIPNADTGYYDRYNDLWD